MDVGDRIAIWNSTPVEGMVVSTGTPVTSSRLGHHV